MTSLHVPFPRIHHESDADTHVSAAAFYGVARLTLFISGKAYHVQTLNGVDVGIMKAFRLRKFDGTEYDIAQTADGISCDCPDFTFRREAIDPSGCKHIKALIACGLIDAEQADVLTVPPAECTRLPRGRRPRNTDTVYIDSQRAYNNQVQEGHGRLGFPSVVELDLPALNGSSRLDLASVPLPGVPYFKRILMTSLHAPFPRIHHESVAHTPVPAAASHGIARLTLFIGGKAYNVQPLGGHDVAIMKAFRLRKFDGTDYDIAQTAEGISCDCPDFTFRREAIDPSGCKHIKALIACGLIDPGQAKAQTVPPAEVPTPAPPAPAAPVHEPGNVATEVVPANGQPTTLLEIVEHEAMGYKAWGTPAGRFLADQLGRIAQLLRWSAHERPKITKIEWSFTTASCATAITTRATRTASKPAAAKHGRAVRSRIQAAPRPRSGSNQSAASRAISGGTVCGPSNSR